MKTYSQKDTAAIIRKDLKTEFPGQKFSVTCATGSMVYGVDIRWIDGVSERAVTEFLKRYSCRQFDLNGDDAWNYNTVTYQGEEVSFSGDPDPSRKISDELMAQACKVVGVHPDIMNSWRNEDHWDRVAVRELLKDHDASEVYAMTPKSYQAAQDAKAEQERKEMEAAALEREAQTKIYEAERTARDALIAKVAPLSIEETDYRTVAMFAKLNKRSSLEEYREECATPGGFNTDEVRVQKIVTLTPEHYDIFADNLMENWSWLDIGGTGSDWKVREVTNVWEYTEEEREQYMDLAYRHGMVIKAEDRPPFIVDTQGYSYARYVGLASSETPLFPDIERDPTPQEVKDAGLETVDLHAQLQFAQARHRGLCAEMMDVFATFATLQHGAAKLADISARVAGAEAEVKELTLKLLELASAKCKPTRGAWQIMGSAQPQHRGMLN